MCSDWYSGTSTHYTFIHCCLQVGYIRENRNCDTTRRKSGNNFIYGITVPSQRNPFREVLVERFRVIEHPVHISDLGHVPFREVLVERFRVIEHPVHISDLGHVPFREVLVEPTFSREQASHISDTANVPFSNWRAAKFTSVRCIECVSVTITRYTFIHCCLQVGYSRENRNCDTTRRWSVIYGITVPRSVEGGGATEHVAAGHISDCRRVPFREVLVEPTFALEHVGHVGDIRHVPFSNWRAAKFTSVRCIECVSVTSTLYTFIHCCLQVCSVVVVW